MAPRTTKTKTTTPTPEATSGRPMSATSQERAKSIVALVTETPGITNAAVAEALGMTTLATGQFVNAMVKRGEIALWKLPNAQRTYYLPKVLEKQRDKLQKAYDAEASAAAAKPARSSKPKPSPEASAAEPAKSRSRKKAAPAAEPASAPVAKGRSRKKAAPASASAAA